MTETREQVTTASAGSAHAECRHRPDPMWFRVLDRFGLPTLFAVALLWFTLSGAREDRSERRDILSRLTHAIEAQTVAFRELAEAEKQHADAVRLTWPKLRPHEESLRTLRSKKAPEGSP